MNLDLIIKAFEESLKVMEEYPVRNRFAKAIVLSRLALEEIENARLQTGIPDTEGQRGVTRPDGEAKGKAGIR